MAENMEQRRKTAAIILAAGCGSRMGTDEPKQRLTLGGQSILYRTVRAFDASDVIDCLVLVTREEDLSFATDIAATCRKSCCVTLGGHDRQASSALGVAAVSDDVAFVAIHDGARCLVTGEIIEKTVREAWQFGAACAVSPVSDTVKSVKDACQIVATLDRDALRLAETPQVFSVDLYTRASAFAKAHGVKVTDDASLVEAMGGTVRAVEHGDINAKITYPKDLILAEFVLRQREDMA